MGKGGETVGDFYSLYREQVMGKGLSHESRFGVNSLQTFCSSFNSTLQSA